MNGKGELSTLEGSPEIANIAKKTLNKFSLKNTFVVEGSFQNTLQGVLKTTEPVDFFFNDGHHDYDAVLNYFEQALPYLSEDSVMIFDDISWSAGMRKAWKEIEDNENVRLSIDLQYIGIAYLSQNISKKNKIRVSNFGQ